MRARLRAACLVVLATSAVAGLGQTIKVKTDTVDATDVNARRLWEGEVRVLGQGSKVPGMDLTDRRNVRHWIGDDTAFSSRVYVDTAWAKLGSSMDSVSPGATVHWVRYHILPDTSLKGDPMLLNVQVEGGFTLFLNGQFLLRSDARLVPHGMANDLPGVSVPFSFRCDGVLEVLAFRIVVPPGINLKDAGLKVSLHTADSAFRMQRSLMNYGLFIGINLIILLMALVSGWSERKERAWLLLAGLSFVSVLDTLRVLGGSMGALGLPISVAEVLRMCRLLTVPWGMYLLILVLLELRAELTRKRSRWYAGGIITLTIIVLPVIFSVPFVVSGSMITVSGKDPGEDVALILAIIFCSLIALSILAWFVVEEVRLGIKLWRTKGHARWVGAGAVAASLLTLLLAIAGELAGLGLSRWLAVLANYCSFVAVPVSVAIYLSIRSAHHTRLVTRQRDELDQEVQDRTAELRAEKERSDDLLLNILPHEVAEELKDTGTAVAKHFDQATVLFSDFRGFTQLSEKLSPEELVREIDTCFKHFDGLMDKWRMEKIKTIGDSYMAAGGLPDPTKGSPADVVRAALDMQDFMRQHAAYRSAQGLPMFQMRVGIHTGPVVAGIVGVKKFQYDIWGDTVNTASRMETAGEEGRVNISASLYELVRDEADLVFTPRGMVQAKGKGEMEMYFVSRADPAVPRPTPDA